MTSGAKAKAYVAAAEAGEFYPAKLVLHAMINEGVHRYLQEQKPQTETSGQLKKEQT